MKKISLVIVISLTLLACNKTEQISSHKAQEENESANVIKALNYDASKVPIKNKLPASDYMLIEWIDLMPKEDLDALLNPPAYINEIVDGSDEDTLDKSFKNESDNIDDYLYEQALVSRNIKESFNNTPVKIPAFIVPLEFDDDQKVTKFFMVPFFGACLHLPPPPPNQTIFVNYPQGVKLESTYDAYWVSGIIKTSVVENEIATSAYSIEMHDFEIYTD